MPSSLSRLPAARAFFADRPFAQSLFESLEEEVRKLGEVEVDATKSRVAFKRRTRFLWVHEATRDGIWIGMLMPEPLESPRVRTAPVGKRWSCHLKLTGPVDKELRGWMKRAFEADAPGPAKQK